MEWIQGKIKIDGEICSDPDYYYCQTKTGGASILLMADGKWRWNANTKIGFVIDMDGDWGTCKTQECAQRCAEEWLRINDRDNT